MSSTAPQRRAWLAPQLTGAALGRARLAVVPRLRSRAPRVPFLVLVSLILLGGVIGLLLFNTSMQQAAFTSARLDDQAEVLAAREKQLRTELDALDSPDRVARLACLSYGMVVGPQAAFIDLRTGRVTGTPAAPPPGSSCIGTPPTPAPVPTTPRGRGR